MSGRLAIDTAGATMAVAFDLDGDVRIREHARPQEHSKVLLQLVDEVCDGSRDRIGEIVVTRGPGGYAGVRVGVATAQGLALALGVPHAGVTTFEAIVEAARTHGCAGDVVAVHPAGRGEYATCAAGGSGTVIGMLNDAPPGTLCGEAMADHGGMTLTASDRCRAALALLERGLTGDPEALYVREPHITLARKNPVSGAAAATPGRKRGGTS